MGIGKKRVGGLTKWGKLGIVYISDGETTCREAEAEAVLL